jgi:hypothetical protein
MSSYAESIRGEDRWYLANYLAATAQGDVREEMILKAVQTNGAIPLGADAAIWRSLEPKNIFLKG